MLTISETKEKIAELKKRKQELEQQLSQVQVGREESVSEAVVVTSPLLTHLADDGCRTRGATYLRP